MSHIAVSFTLKNQSMDKIIPCLEKIAQMEEEPILCHAFLSREDVIEKNLPTDLVDTLDEYFPNQINFSKTMPYSIVDSRKVMVEFMKQVGGKVYIIGNIIEGVAQEEQMYKETGVKIEYLK